MESARSDQNSSGKQVRLLLEDVCSDLVRFLYSKDNPARFEAVRISREYALGSPGVFADLRVEPEGEPPYFLEVKYGYNSETLVAHVLRKYKFLPPRANGISRLVLVVETSAHDDWPSTEATLRRQLPTTLLLEVWDEQYLQRLISECFGQAIPSFSTTDLISIRERIDVGKDHLAFGDAESKGYAEDVLRQNLLWHFGTWRLRELRHARGYRELSDLVSPGVYEQVIVLMADLSGFSRFVRDTPDAAIVRESLTDFYSKARYQVINAGGMLDQFVGDEIVAIFGIPDRRPGYQDAAVRTAFRLLDIGASVQHSWQRKIDLAQTNTGAHVSLTMGQIQLVSMRAFDEARLSIIGDCLNIASRLLPLARSGEVVVSNVLRNALQLSEYEFSECEPVEARNIGTLRSWRLHPPSGTNSPTT